MFNTSYTQAGEPFVLDHNHPDFRTKFKPKGLHCCAACWCDINDTWEHGCIAYPVVYDFTDDYGRYIFPKGSIAHVCARCFEGKPRYEPGIKSVDLAIELLLEKGFTPENYAYVYKRYKNNEGWK
jgi:hypothetical protein